MVRPLVTSISPTDLTRDALIRATVFTFGIAEVAAGAVVPFPAGGGDPIPAGSRLGGAKSSSIGRGGITPGRTPLKIIGILPDLDLIGYAPVLQSTVQHLEVLVFGRGKYQQDDARLAVGLQAVPQRLPDRILPFLGPFYFNGISAGQDIDPAVGDGIFPLSVEVGVYPVGVRTLGLGGKDGGCRQKEVYS